MYDLNNLPIPTLEESTSSKKENGKLYVVKNGGRIIMEQKTFVDS